MPDANPSEQAPPEEVKPLPVAAPAAEVKPSQPESIQATQLPPSAEKVDVTPNALKKNEQNTLKLADEKTKTALSRLDVLKNITVG